MKMHHRICTDAETVSNYPWLGRDRFEDPRPGAARRIVAETQEERFWRSLLPSLFAPGDTPGPVARALNHVAVVPIAHVTFLNLDYQIYLNHLMHTSAGAWIGHLICIPINVGLLFYALAIHTGGAWINAGLLLLALLATWYVAMARRLDNALWGAVVLALLGGLWVGANAGASSALALARGGELPWQHSPIVLIAIVSSLQAYSHLFEDNVPPRANFEEGWLPVRAFLWGEASELSLARRVLRLAWTPLGGLWGTLDEWWASAKLMPVYVLELMWMLGYRTEQRARHRALALEALESGDPALDFVGVGGGVSVAALGEPNADDAELPALVDPAWVG